MTPVRDSTPRPRPRRTMPTAPVALATLSFALAVAPTAQQSVRYVPQTALAGLAPVSVEAPPTGSNALLILNLGGRLDTVTVTAMGETQKLQEIQGSHTVLTFSADGSRLATGDRDGTLWLWNARRGFPLTQPAQLPSHSAAVTSIALSPDGRTLVSGDARGTLRRSTMEAGAWIATRPQLGSHAQSVTSIAVSRDGTRVFSTAADGTVAVWTTDGTVEGRPVPLPDYFGGVAHIAVHDDAARIFAAGPYGAPYVWQVGGDGAVRGPWPFQHAIGGVSSVGSSPDGLRVAFGADDGTVGLWRVEDRTRIGSLLEAHTARVTSVTFDPKGGRLFSAARDGKVHVWDLAGAQPGPVVRRDSLSGVLDLAFTPDGRSILSAGRDGRVHLSELPAPLPAVDSNTSSLVASLGEGVFVSAFNRDRTQIVVGYDDGRLGISDLQTHTFREIGRAAGAPGRAVTALAIGDQAGKLISGDVSGTLRIWRLADGVLLREHADRGRRMITSIAISLDGTRFAWGDSRGTVRLSSLESGIDPVVLDRAALGLVREVAFNPDGTRLAVAGPDDTVRVWNVAGVPTELSGLSGHDGEVWRVAFSPNGELLVTGGADGTVRLWDVDRARMLGVPLRPHDKAVTAVAFSGDGRLVASGGWDAAVRLWTAGAPTTPDATVEGRSGVLMPTEQQNTIRLYPQRSWMAHHEWDGSIALADLDQDVALDEVELVFLPPSARMSVATSDTGVRLVSGGWDGSVLLWSTTDSVGPRTLHHHDDSVSRVVLSHGGAHVVTGDIAGTTRISGIDDGTSSDLSGDGRGRHLGMVLSIDVTRDGTRVVSGDTEGSLHLWHVGATLEMYPLDGHEAPVSAVALSPNGQRVASCDTRGVLRVWNAEVGRTLLGELRPRGMGCGSVAFGSDGIRLVSGHRDGTLRLWDVGEMRAAGPPTGGHSGWVSHVAFSPDGRRLASTGTDGLRVWRIRDGALEPSGRQRGAVGAVRWLGRDVIASELADRFLVFDSQARPRGALFPVAEGLVGVVPGSGVYASDAALGDAVLRFRDQEYEGLAPAITRDTMRDVLLDQRRMIARVWNSVLELGAAIADAVGRTHRVFVRHLGLATYPAWLFLFWLLANAVALAAWIVDPARLASLAMRAGAESGDRPGGGAQWRNVATTVILPFRWWGRTGRAVKAWLRKNRRTLLAKCYTERAEVVLRGTYCEVDDGSAVRRLREAVRCSAPGAFWISGVGGSGKSAFAMHLCRTVLVGEIGAPMPVLVGEEWKGSLATQVARQLSVVRGGRGPSEKMVKDVLGGEGVVCPLVDSLSELNMDDAVGSVGTALGQQDFRYIIVTARSGPPRGQAWEDVIHLEMEDLKREDTEAFIRAYAPKEESLVRDVIGAQFESRMPSPLFLRLAIEQTRDGQLSKETKRGNIGLVLQYVDGLCNGGRTISSDVLRRVASIAAIVSVQKNLWPRGFLREELHGQLAAEGNAGTFYDAVTKKNMSSGELIQVLVESGILVDRSRLQFAYDPVAEYLAAWRVWQNPRESLNHLRSRVEMDEESPVGRAYREMVRQSGGD